jgi:hypothetical protein
MGAGHGTQPEPEQDRFQDVSRLPQIGADLVVAQRPQDAGPVPADRRVLTLAALA